MDFPDSQKALRRSLPPAGGKEILIVFPAACTWEKHSARSERRIVCRRQTTEAQSGAKTPSKKMQSIFFDT